MRVVNIVRERISEEWTTTDSFLVEDRVSNPEEALRNAVRDYMQSEEGKKDIVDSNYDFNWGDVMMNITDEYLKPHGLQFCHQEIETIVVNQDEILFPELQESILSME